MGYSITYDEEGFHWSVFFSSHGAAVGCEPTIEEAIVELDIAERDLIEEPYKIETKRAMRSNPVAYVNGPRRKVIMPWDSRWRGMDPYNGPIPAEIALMRKPC